MLIACYLNQNPLNYTVKEYLELDRNSPDARYEYYDGFIRMVSGGTGHHSMISVNISSRLNVALSDSPCGVFNSDMRVQIDAARYVYPCNGNMRS